MRKLLIPLLFIFYPCYLIADISPERILGKSCLQSYQKTYSSLKEFKAFVYAREKETGRDYCQWSYAASTLEEAIEQAMKNCNGKRRSPCKVVDKNGEFVVKRLDFTPIVPLDDTPLSHEKKAAILGKAKFLIKGNCFPFFEKYLQQPGYKAFAYSLDTEGKYACGYAYNNQNQQIAKRGAAKSCENDKKKRGKNQSVAKCQVYAVHNDIVLESKDFGFSEKALLESSCKKALYKGKVNEVKKCIKNGLDVNFTSKDGNTPLLLAAAKGEDEWFYQLIKNGADIHHSMSDGTNLLHAATMGESPDIIRFLLKKGFDINAGANGGYRPIHIAFAKLNTYLIALLTRQGADLSLKNEEGISAHDLGKRLKVNFKEIRKIDATTMDDGFYPLFDAVKFGDLEMIRLLKDKGADINKIERGGMSPFSMAKNARTMRLLKQLGADVNLQDEDGVTALMYHADDNKKSKINLLLELGADKTLKDKKGRTAYDLIKNRKTVSEEVKKLLKPE